MHPYATALSLYLKLLLSLHYLCQGLEQCRTDNPQITYIGLWSASWISFFFQQTDLPPKLYFIVPVLKVVLLPECVTTVVIKVAQLLCDEEMAVHT